MQFKPYETTVQVSGRINVNSVEPEFIVAWCKARAELSRTDHTGYSNRASEHLEAAARSVAAAYGIDYDDVIAFSPIIKD